MLADPSTHRADRRRPPVPSETPIWEINGAHLGPTLRARCGDQVTITVTNTLPETTSLHWHGVILRSWGQGGQA